MRIIRDPYTSEDRLYKRLKEEFEKHGKLIIAVDFDDTVFNTHNNPGWAYTGVVETLLRWQENAEIICWTASLPDRYEFIRGVFNAHGIQLSGININAPGIEPRGPKIYANIYLDDRSCGLEQALRCLNLLADVKGF